MSWKRADVELGMLFTLGDPGDDVVYRVVGLIDEPVVVLEPADERDGEEPEYHVISSAVFADYRRVETRHADGTEQRRWDPHDRSSP